MKERKVVSKNLIMIILAIAISLGVAIPLIVRAALGDSLSDRPRAVHLKNKDIPTSSIIVGSYIIHIDGYSEELYEAATQSASAFEQEGVYYKSELADGAWFEISSASSIDDIIGSGNPVSGKEIEDLWFTHMTDQYGITTDLVAGRTIEPFSVPDPYDLENMEELLGLKLLYQTLTDKENSMKSDSDKEYIAIIRDFFSLDVRNEVTYDCDLKISQLEVYRLNLISRDASNYLREETYKVMAHEDALRRIEVYNNLENVLNELMMMASGNKAMDSKVLEAALYNEPVVSDDSEEEEEANEDLVVNNDIVTAISEAISNVGNAAATYAGKVIEDGSTTIASVRYGHVNQLISGAQSANFSSCDREAGVLADITNISESIIADVESEIKTLEEELLTKSQTSYDRKIRAGVSNDYKKAAIEGMNETVLQHYVELQDAEISSYLTDFEFLISAYLERIANDKGQTFCLNKIDEIEMLKLNIRNDAAKTILTNSVNDLIEFLQSKYSELVKDAADSSALDALNDELNNLENDKREAVDNGDLGKAKELEAQIDNLQSQIDALTKNLTDILNDPNASASDKAKAKAGLLDGTAAKIINDLAAKAAANLRNGQSADTQINALAGIVDLDPNAGKAAYDTLLGAGNGSGSSSSGTGLDADLLDNLLDGIGLIEDALANGNADADVDAATAAGLIDQFAKDAANKIKNGKKVKGLAKEIAELAPYNKDAAQDALDALINAANDAAGNGSSASTTDNSDLLAGLKDAVDSALKKKGTPELSYFKDMIRDAILSVTGTDVGKELDLSKLNSQQKIAVLIGMAAFVDKYSSAELKSFIGQKANNFYEESNPYIYNKKSDEIIKYAPLTNVSRLCEKRYIFDDTRKMVTLQDRVDYYSFIDAQKKYETTGAEIGDLGYKAVFYDQTLYISESDLGKLFGYNIRYENKIPTYGFIVDAGINDIASQIEAYLLGVVE